MDQNKKRKRSAEEGTDNMRHATIKVKHVAPEELALGPIVASTPGLSAPEDITFTPYRRTIASRTTDKRRRQVLLQSSQHGRLDYIAQEEDAGGPAGSLKHYIAIYDAEAGEFTVTECHKVTLRGTLRPTQEELDDEKAQRDRATYASQRMTLGQEFGTKKAKKVIADQTVNAINQRRLGETAPPVDAAQQAVLDDLNVKTEGMMTAEERQQEVDKNKPRPDPNMQATQPVDVYPINSLVSSDDLALVKVMDWQSAMKKGENVKLRMRYIAHRLRSVATTRDSTNLKLLKYLDIMLMWYSALEKKRGVRTVPHRDKLQEKVDAPNAILESLRKKFTDGRQLTKWHTDKLFCYICALALHIDNFEVDTNDLQDDLQLAPNEMAKYFMELGCKVVGMTAAERDRARLSTKDATSRRMARLVLPLEFPKVRNKNAQGRR